MMWKEIVLVFKMSFGFVKSQVCTVFSSAVHIFDVPGNGQETIFKGFQDPVNASRI